MTAEQSSRGRGRPAVSTREDIEQVAMRLFTEQGYSTTTIPMIAEAAQVSRSSVFRYWGSKSEIVWAEFDRHITRLGTRLTECGSDAGATMDLVRRAAVSTLDLSIQDSKVWWERFVLLDSTDDLKAEEALHWAAWANTVAAFIASRHDYAVTDVIPQAAAGAAQGAFLAVLRSQLGETHDARNTVLQVLDEALRSAAPVLQAWIDSRPLP